MDNETFNCPIQLYKQCRVETPWINKSSSYQTEAMLAQTVPLLCHFASFDELRATGRVDNNKEICHSNAAAF